MENIKYIIFDCMETLIDIDNFSQPEDYARHAYYGSGAEVYWPDFNHFYQAYSEVRDRLARDLPEHKEDDFFTRFELLCKSNCRIHASNVDRVANQIFTNFWQKYSDSCYIRTDVVEVLQALAGRYKLGVVSNFKVKGGIEKLLGDHGIGQHFEFIITSVSIGWVKPNRLIYEAMMQKTNCPPREHLFIGDDYENDFEQPRRIGMKALLLDRQNRYENIDDRIINMYGLPDKLPLA